MDIILYIIVLIFSVMLHEVAHGYMANYLGDPTARLQGRLTLNPISHIDPIGSIFLPLILKLSGSPILIGYAKPVPYNPYNLPGAYDEALVAGAGPATNVLLALVFGLAIRFGSNVMGGTLLSTFELIVILNIALAIFNLIPIPPLDGSKVLGALLPGALGRWYDDIRHTLERLGVLTGTLLLLVIFYLLSSYFFIAIQYVFTLIAGRPLF